VGDERSDLVTLVLEDRHVNAIRRHGEADYPAEACGLIGGTVDGDRKVAVQLVPLVNQRTDAARRRYEIDPESFRRAQQKLDRDGLDVIGVYHSHPDHPPTPSAYDREHAWPWLSYVIVGVNSGRADQLKSWTLSDDRTVFDEESLTIEERNAVWR
jgi:proteasome lid subunit RPN8/RPN11